MEIKVGELYKVVEIGPMSAWHDDHLNNLVIEITSYNGTLVGGYHMVDAKIVSGSIENRKGPGRCIVFHGVKLEPYNLRQPEEKPKVKRPKVEMLNANHAVIHTKNGRYLQSYDTIIAFVTNDGNKIYLDSKSWNHSRTTARWRNSFLGMTNAEVNRGVTAGKFIMKNLND